MTEIAFTNHLKDRIKQRGLDLAEVDKTIRFPDQIITNSKRSSKKHLKTFSNHQLVVVIKTQGNRWVVASAWQRPLKPGSSPTSTPKPFFLEKLISSFLLRIEKAFRRRFQR